ncbi:MAG: prepilin peptidase [Acidobacteria bacterium]|jgi:leader peptidase (prepilin peptidase)/N-methyltransferase|nr:MAG: prepilin peptidase [Acidobacteriota bacterium]GIU82138.1 MAG: type 4 prepilin-like proteins leader peptide-processing enzyme [Pyrinomonadaceae bacterium]
MNQELPSFVNAESVFLGISFFSLGAIIGSFLNVVIYRVPRRESIVFPNSFCPECKTPIKPYDNIPILSWIILKGKCRHCKGKISLRYPFVEFLTATIFFLTFKHIGLNAFLPFALAFVSAMIALIFIDAEHMILPDVITYPLFVLALVSRLAFALFFGKEFFSDLNYFPATAIEGFPSWIVTLISAIFGALVGSGFLLITAKLWEYLRKVEAMGMGDVKMMLGVGAFLGWRLTFLTIFFGAFTGSLAGVAISLIRGERNLQTQIPFGVFLGAGAIVSLLLGEQIINAYLQAFSP